MFHTTELDSIKGVKHFHEIGRMADSSFQNVGSHTTCFTSHRVVMDMKPWLSVNQDAQFFSQISEWDWVFASMIMGKTRSLPNLNVTIYVDEDGVLTVLQYNSRYLCLAKI